ncbi:MAG: S8 family serine peptidase, partial [Tumebacillaceae bacterium]
DKAKESVLAPLSAQDDVAMIPTQYLPYYTTMSGTSMATPHIAGVVALLDEANSSLTPDQIKQILQDTATRMPGYESFEVGSGYVNAYAAIDKAQHMDHGYGAVVNQTFHSQYNGTVDYQAPTNTAFSPLAATSFTFNVGDNALVSDLTVAWDSPANLLTVKVTAPDGTATSYGANVLSAVYGTQTSVPLNTPQKGTWKVDVTGAKGLIGIPDNVHFSYRTYYGTFSGLSDVSGNAFEAAIRTAVSKRLLDSADATNFNPNGLITKGDLAHWIASDFEIRQNQTQALAFTDVSSDLAPYVSAVTSAAAPMRDVFWQGGNVISGNSATLFGTSDSVNRTGLAVALVKALGLDALAQQNMSTATTFSDDAQIPANARGYVVVATQKGLLKGYDNATTQTTSFRPSENVNRGAFADSLVNGYNYFISGQ